ncbi:hypothetical protein U1Q18_052864 [Sarracenia purpurea var. burkii]
MILPRVPNSQITAANESVAVQTLSRSKHIGRRPHSGLISLDQVDNLITRTNRVQGTLGTRSYQRSRQNRWNPQNGLSMSRANLDRRQVFGKIHQEGRRAFFPRKTGRRERSILLRFYLIELRRHDRPPLLRNVPISIEAVVPVLRYPNADLLARHMFLKKCSHPGFEVCTLFCKLLAQPNNLRLQKIHLDIPRFVGLYGGILLVNHLPIGFSILFGHFRQRTGLLPRGVQLSRQGLHFLLLLQPVIVKVRHPKDALIPDGSGLQKYINPYRATQRKMPAPFSKNVPWLAVGTTDPWHLGESSVEDPLDPPLSGPSQKRHDQLNPRQRQMSGWGPGHRQAEQCSRSPCRWILQKSSRAHPSAPGYSWETTFLSPTDFPPVVLPWALLPESPPFLPLWPESRQPSDEHCDAWGSQQTLDASSTAEAEPLGVQTSLRSKKKRKLKKKKKKCKAQRKK